MCLHTAHWYFSLFVDRKIEHSSPKCQMSIKRKINAEIDSGSTYLGIPHLWDDFFVSTKKSAMQWHKNWFLSKKKMKLLNFYKIPPDWILIYLLSMLLIKAKGLGRWVFSVCIQPRVCFWTSYWCLQNYPLKMTHLCQSSAMQVALT